MADHVKSASSPADIGARIRMIRRRRGLGLKTAADLAGISKTYLSRLENGQRRFDRRGLIEDLAAALGCAPIDITGEPYTPTDQPSAEALATLPAISIALNDTTLDDVPDVPARPVDELVRWAARANEHSANSRYSLAGRDLGALLTELHVQSVSGDSDTRRKALPALVEACFVACGSARSLGRPELAVQAARRGYDGARALGDPALVAFAAMPRTTALMRLGARHRASRVATGAVTEIEPLADPTAEDTTAAQACRMLHLSLAQLAAKDHRPDDADTHLSEARALASRVGEANTLQFSFGPSNTQAWALSIAVELERGPEAAEAVERQPGYAKGLTTDDRRAAVHFDLARAYSQAEGARDAEAVRHLDAADRIAPQRIRHDPVAREVLAELENRARRKVWELGSLRNRFGMG